MADLSGASWRKSGFSGGGNDCVELAKTPNIAAVRDSKNTSKVIELSERSFACFLAAARSGGFTS